MNNPKEYRTIFIILTIFISQTILGNTFNKSYPISYSESDFTINYNSDGQITILSHNIAAFPENNEPALPIFTTNILVPPCYKYLKSEISVCKRLLLKDIEIIQSPKPVPYSQICNIPYSKTVPSYLPEIYPQVSCKFIGGTEWDNATVLNFFTSPFEYDAVEKKLYFNDSINIEITFISETDAKFKNNQSNFKTPIGNVDCNTLRNYVINPHEVDDILSSVSIQSLTEEQIDYVIITSEELKPSFQPLIDWKRTKGLYSKILTMEEIRRNYSGEDDQYRLKKCLYDLHINNSLKYVLLGGDDTVVPVRGCYGKVISGETEYIDSTIPCDLYYACFGGIFNWDANGNGIYGESTDSISLNQSIYLTRLPIQTSLSAQTIVERILSYEQNPKFFSKFLSSGVKQSSYDPVTNRSDSDLQDNIFYNILSSSWKGEYIKFFDTYTDFKEGADFNVTANNLSNVLKDGFAFINISTHGSPISWQMEMGDSYTTDYGLLQQNIAHSHITTTSCNTNAFDFDPIEPCLSESFIQNPLSGVLTYLGSSRLGWGSNEFISIGGPSGNYNITFYQELLNSNIESKNFGQIVSAVKTSLIGLSSLLDTYKWLQFSLNPIGDPEMPIFTDVPKLFNQVSISQSNSNLIIDSGVMNSKICIMSSNDNGLSYYKVFDNVETITCSNLPTNITVCITKTGYIPIVLHTIYYPGTTDIQNETFIKDSTITSDLIKIGTNVTNEKNPGKVIIEKGKTSITAKETLISPELIVKKGAELILRSK